MPADDNTKVTPRPSTAVFLVRVWWEEGGFRARITYHLDINSNTDVETRILTADPAEVRQHLATWLDESAAEAAP